MYRAACLHMDKMDMDKIQQLCIQIIIYMNAFRSQLIKTFF